MLNGFSENKIHGQFDKRCLIFLREQQLDGGSAEELRLDRQTAQFGRIFSSLPCSVKSDDADIFRNSDPHAFQTIDNAACGRVRCCKNGGSAAGECIECFLEKFILTGRDKICKCRIDDRLFL